MSDNGNWYTAAATRDLKDDEPLGVQVGGHHIALFRQGDDFYATGDMCTHAQQLLSAGWLDGCEIECPLHMGRFDIRTGEALTSPVEVDLPTYRVRVAGENLDVFIPATTPEG